MNHQDLIKKYFPEHFKDTDFMKEIESMNECDLFFIYNFAHKWQSVDYPLYHYTSVEALVNILKTKKLWLFRFNEMNDPNEILYGIYNIQIALKKLYNAGTLSPTQCKKLLGYLESGMEDPVHNKTCFFSLTKEDDHLPAWRWYGDDGRGVCIRFSACDIKGFDLYQVIYDAGKFRELAEIFLTDIYEAPLSMFPEKDFLQYLTAIIKMDYYKEEEEWRILPYRKSLELKEILIKNKLKKYYEVPLECENNNFPIDKIIVGPAAVSGTQTYLSNLVKSLNLDIAITTSGKHYKNTSNLAQKCYEDRKRIYADMHIWENS